jgi:hypothetical protein
MGQMSIVASDFRQYIIDPALAALAPAGIPVTKTAADLLMATAANETDLGTWLNQNPGPALGVFQIEPASLSSLLVRLTTAQTAALVGISTPQPITAQLDTNLVLAAAICRLFYWHNPFVMPQSWTLDTLWAVYKSVYNTSAGSATLDGFVSALKLTDISF